MPFVFTEQGVAMLSSILNTDSAIKVNIAIMRTFVKARHLLTTDKILAQRLFDLEKGSNKLFRLIFERLDKLEKTMPTLPSKRKKIGLKN